MQIFTNTIKINLRNRSALFWTLLFPMILGLLFHFAFSNLMGSESFEAVPCGIVMNEAATEEEGFATLLTELSGKSGEEEPVLAVRKYDDEAAAKKALEKGTIEGYFIMTDKDAPAKLVVVKNGLSQTILQEVCDEYFQGYEIMEGLYERAQDALTSLAQKDPAQAAAAMSEAPKVGELTLDETVAEQLYDGPTFFTDISNNEVDATVIYFYTLIGMLCMYGGTFGIMAMKEGEANLSMRAARTVTAPIQKRSILWQSALAGYLMLYAETVIIIFYLNKVLGVDFGNQRGYILLLSAFGCFAGIGLGCFVGVCNKKSEEWKTGFLIAVSMICCFLGGMMMQDMRYILKDNVPVLDRINPVTMITDGLYALYCYQDHDLYWNACIRLALFGAVALCGTFFFIRGKRYDSI